MSQTNHGMDDKGEGDKQAGREYQQQTQQFVEDGKVEVNAKIARDAIEDEQEGRALERAREQTKAKADYDDV